jgi:hypothetical protein
MPEQCRTVQIGPKRTRGLSGAASPNWQAMAPCKTDLGASRESNRLCHRYLGLQEVCAGREPEAEFG